MIQFLFWMVIAIILITAGGAFHIGYHFGREDREPRYAPYRQMAGMFEGQHPYPDAPAEPDAFDLALEEFIDSEPQHPLERLASTGELRVLREQTAWIKTRADQYIESLEGEA
jgi:hypothetical protein